MSDNFVELINDKLDSKNIGASKTPKSTNVSVSKSYPEPVAVFPLTKG